MKYTVAFLKYTLIGLLAIIMLASFIIGAVCALVGILGICLEGNVQYLLLFCAFMGFVALDCACAFVDKCMLNKED